MRIPSDVVSSRTCIIGTPVVYINIGDVIRTVDNSIISAWVVPWKAAEIYIGLWYKTPP